MRVGYLGPPGTFSEEAYLAGAPPGAEGLPLATMLDVVLAVQEGRAERAVVPIENSLEGAVGATLDALASTADRVAIVGEAVLPIAHTLLARPGVTLDQVEAVTSHPQPLAQCAGWLRDHLPAAVRVPAPSTAEAARAVAGREEPWAAIGPRRAGDLYGCVALAEGIEDEPGNATRFAWLAPADAAPDGTRAPAGRSKTSLAFHGHGDASPGWLVGCLAELSSRGINLTKIESRPYRSRLGHYRFFVDLEGAVGEARVDAAIEGLRAHCEVVRVLGSYPAA